MANFVARHLLANTLWKRACIATVSILLVCVISGHAEVGEIHGKLTDKQLDKPLVAQPVTLGVHRADTVESQETVTDEAGHYRFADLPLDPSVHYTVATTYEGTEYSEKDLVLSTWAPNITVDIDIGAMSRDRSKIRINAHTLVIGPPPADHAPDGAVSIMEVLQVENQNDLPFQTVHDTQPVGLHLGLPHGYEGFQPHTSHELSVNPKTNQVVMTTPLPPGQLEFGYTYILHVEEAGLDLSRQIQFDTERLHVFVPFALGGMNLSPAADRFPELRLESVRNRIYAIHSSAQNAPFFADEPVDLTLKPVVLLLKPATDERNVGLGQMALIAVAAALAGGFFVAALFKLRDASRSDATREDEPRADAEPDAGWLGKLTDADLEDVRVARLEFITHLDDALENRRISARVYKRLRREQTERLSATLAQRKSRGLA